MALRFLYLFFVRVTQLVRSSWRGDEELAMEVVMLRHEVSVLRRQVTRPSLQPADRALLAGLARLLPRQPLGPFFVLSDSLLRWHRALVRRSRTYPYRRPGRLPIRSAIVEDHNTVYLARLLDRPGRTGCMQAVQRSDEGWPSVRSAWPHLCLAAAQLVQQLAGVCGHKPWSAWVSQYTYGARLASRGTGGIPRTALLVPTRRRPGRPAELCSVLPTRPTRRAARQEWSSDADSRR
jgi:hypothetical protein